MRLEPPTLRQELQTYRQSIVDDYRESYGELKGNRWRYRYGVSEIIDKANLELKYLWD